jgi:peptidoglycan hydrolase-like protein with peptidoglycan-binding domain
MSQFKRKAAFGLVAITITGTAAFVTAGTATAASVTRAVQTGAVQTAAVALAKRPGAAALNWPVVRQGDSGERVFTLQYLLNARIGARLVLDGKFGPATRAAVRRFQARAGLLVDGEAGSQTWSHLIVQVQKGSTGSAVAGVQHSLRPPYGLRRLAVDGVFGPLTKAAVQLFQKEFKIGADGIVGPVTWFTLVLNEGP